MGTNSNMIPATQEDKELFQTGIRSNYCPDMIRHIEPYAYDPIPGVNSKGGRNVEGWKSVFKASVQKDWTNGLGNLHGAAAAWLVDVVSSVAIAPLATDSWWGPPMLTGVSLAIDMLYYNAAPVGMDLRIVVTVERMNGSLANLRVDISDWDTGRRIASGNHTKTWKAVGAAKL